MAVTKRTRFEVLRRDDHTCQYCGGKAPDVTLQIDHVMPVALGGDDKPTNLLTACRDCNSGKASVPPDSPLVASLGAQAAAYALGMVDKMTRFRSDLESLEEYEESFMDEWERWTFAGETAALPADFRMSLFRWKQMGVPTSIFDLAVPAAMSRTNVKRDDKFTYMAGIVYNMLNERQVDYSVTAETAAVYTEYEMDHIRVDAYEYGLKQGRETTPAGVGF